MRIVVTGGAGFIGSRLTRSLLDAPWVHHVSVVDDLSTGTRENLAGLDVDFREQSILNSVALDDVCRGADAIVHLAARPSVPRSIENPFLTHTVNATGTLAVLEAARRAGRPHVIVASSSSVYGNSPVLPKHEGLPAAPLSPYAASKLAAEAYARAHAAAFDLPVLVLRFFNVFGPGQPAGHAYAAVVPAFVAAALEGRPVPLHGDGSQTRDFTYVGSVVRIMLAALRRGVVHGGPVNCAFGTRRTLLEVIGDLEDVLGRHLAVAPLPPRVGDVRHSQADTARLHGLVPEVEPVPFRMGLQDTVAWMLEQLPARTAPHAADRTASERVPEVAGA